MSWFRFTLLFLIPIFVLAKEVGLPPGTNSELKESFLRTKEKPFEYQKTDVLFFNQVEEFFSLNRYVDSIKLAQKQIDDFGRDTPEGSEARYVMALALAQMGYDFSAFHIFLELAEKRLGSSVSEASLQQLALISQRSPYDEARLNRLLNSFAFPLLHSSIQSFVSYHKYIYNLRFGFTNWAKEFYAQIQPESHWYHLLQYNIAKGEVSRNRPLEAKSIFESISKSEIAAPRLKDYANLQLARLLFEEGKFIEAYNIYSSLKYLTLRDRGRVQLERAWTQYYLKKYDKAMGLLKALSSPLLAPSINHEAFVLEMIIFKQLCYYEAVESVAAQFKKIFQTSLEDIKNRKNLEKNNILFKMALLHGDLQPAANLISFLRHERQNLLQQNWSGKLLNELNPIFEDTDLYLQASLESQVTPYIRPIANSLLEAEEQIQFVEYISTLDKLRIIRRGEERNFSSEKVSYLSFDKVFWPVENEYWNDELEDYKMLISSKCGGLNSTPQKQNSNDDSNNNSEEEFE